MLEARNVSCTQQDNCGQCNWVCADQKTQTIEGSSALWAKVRSYEHPELVNRMATEHGISHDEAYRWFKLGLNYLYQAATTKGPVSPSVYADRMWHTFLLYSKDYREFCQEMFGFFIDHFPTPKLGGGKNGDDKKEDIKKEYESDKDAFKEKYDVPDDPAQPLPPSGDPKKH